MTWPMYQRREVEANGALILLTRMECEVVAFLLLRRDRFTDWHILAECIWQGSGEPEYAKDSLNVIISRIRRKGVPIGGTLMRGLRL